MIYSILENKALSVDVYMMTIEAPAIAASCYPGQFLSVLVPYDKSLLLRRPISICDTKDKSVTIIYQIKGEGTRLISTLKEGDWVDVLGPLGVGFPVPENKKTAIVGGGIGVFPLLFLKNRLISNNSVDCYLGYKNKECVLLCDEFSYGTSNVCVSTDDGSLYNCGYITDFFEKDSSSFDIVYSCGPKDMLRQVKRICEKNNTLLYVSLEERMGCGIGACLVCACKTYADNGPGFDYKHVCKDGPVFDSREVIL